MRRLRRRRLVLRVSADHVSAEIARGDVILWSAEAEHEGYADLAGAVAGLLGSAPRMQRVDIELEAPIVQVRTLSGLPPVSDSALAALVATQAGRYFRRNGKPLVTAAAWVERRRKDRSTVHAAAVEEPWLEAIAEGVREAGLTLATVAAGKLELMSAAERTRRRRRAWGSVRVLALAATTIWIAVGAFAVLRLTGERRRIDREIARYEAPAASALEARRMVDAARQSIAAVQRSRAAQGTAALRLAAVAAALPDKSYLTSLQWDSAGEGLLTGAAPRAADVVASLERGGIVAPRLDGPPVREAGSDGPRERFTIRFDAGRVP